MVILRIISGSDDVMTYLHDLTSNMEASITAEIQH